VVSNDINRYIGAGEESKAKRLFFQYNGLRVLAGFVLWAGLFFGSLLFQDKYPPNFIGWVQLLSVVLMLETLYYLPRSLLGMRMMFSYSASRTSSYKFFQAGFLLFSFFFSKITVGLAIWSLIVGSVGSSLLLISPVIKAYKPWVGLKRAEGNLLYKIFRTNGKWDIINTFFSKITTSIQPWLIKFFVSTEAVAVFSVAQTMAGLLPGFFPTNTLGTMVPQSMHDKELFRRVFRLSSKYLVFLSILMGLAAAAGAPIVIHFLFQKYALSLPYFFVLLLTLPFTALGVIGTIYLIAIRQQKSLFFQKVLKSVLNVPLLLIFLPLFGLWGLVIQTLFLAPTLVWSMYSFIYHYYPELRFHPAEFFTFNGEDKNFIKNIYRFVSSSVVRRLKKLPFAGMFLANMG
jgi:O-antigen/teichoic acid export membrane protein